MGEYTKKTAAFKATTIDVRLLNSKLVNADKLNAKNIIVETGYNQLSDIVSYIKEKDNEVSSKFVESTYTVENDGGISGNVVLFILPCDAYPQNVPFSRMTVPVTSGVPLMESGGLTTPVYLGVVQWNADGTKEIYGISDNQVTCNKWSDATWNFDTKPIVFTNDYRLIFYFIVNKEDFTTTEPTVYKDKIKITTRLHKTLDDIDPYYNWDRALTDLRLGWICNNSFSLGSSYPNWPVCTFTTSKLTQLIQNSSNLLSIVDTHTELINELESNVDALEANLNLVQEQVNTNTESIDSISQDVEVNSENIEALRHDVNSIFILQDAVRDVNTMQGTLDNATIYGVLYSREHFGIYGTQINKVTLPYSTQSGQSNTGYLVAQVFDHDNQLIANYYSEGTHTFSNAGPAVFNFVDTYIAANYKFIRFILVANKTVTIPTSYNSINSNCLSFRARPIKWQESFVFDDDDCLVYSNQSTGTLNWLIGMTIDYKLHTAPSMDDFVTEEELNELESSLDQVQDKVNTNIELISYLDQKITDNLDAMLDQINGLDQGVGEQVNQASGRINDLELQNLVLTNTVGELINIIDTNNTAKFSNSDGYELDNATIKGFRLSSAHFIKDKRVTSIDLPYTYRDGESPANVYLYIELYNAHNECILRLYSVNTDSQTSDKSVLHYKFTSLVMPEAYQYALFTLVTTDTKTTLDLESIFPDIVQGTNCSAFRARPLRSNGSVDFDDDDCLCFDSSQNQLNWLVSIQGAYIVGFSLPSAADYSFRVTPIYTEAGVMDYFNVSSGNVYMENKLIVLIPTKTELRMNSDMGTSLYVLLTVSNKADGSISYSYKAVNETEMEVLGYLFITPIEEDLSIDTSAYSVSNVVSTLSIEDPGMVMSLDEGDVTDAQEIEPILTNL